MTSIASPSMRRFSGPTNVVLLAVALLAFGALQAYALVSGQTVWAQRYAGAGVSDDYARDIAVDQGNNVYVIGGSASDYVTIKYGPAGYRKWVRRYDGPGNEVGWGEVDSAAAVAVDAVGNIYVTGSSPGVSGVDYATLKYDAQGNVKWVRRYDGPTHGDDLAADVAVDAAANVYVTGESASDYVTIKYDTFGNRKWLRRYSRPVGNSLDAPSAIGVDRLGNVYVAGTSDGDYATVSYSPAGNFRWRRRYNGPLGGDDRLHDLAIGPGGVVVVTGSSMGVGFMNDYVTIKYNGGGNVLWQRRYDGPTSKSDDAGRVVVDGTGNVYVTGETGFDFFVWTPGDATTIKYGVNGNLLWARHYAGPGSSSDSAYAMAISRDQQRVFVAGMTGPMGVANFLTIGYSSAGVQQWVRQYNGPANSYDVAVGVAVDGLGSVYATGMSMDSWDTFDIATLKYAQ